MFGEDQDEGFGVTVGWGIVCWAMAFGRQEEESNTQIISC